MKNQVVSVYRQAERFANITQKFLIAGNIPRVQKCLAFAERHLKNGSNETKNAISCIYVHSVSSLMELRNCKITGLFPEALMTEYLKQINTSGV